MNGDALIILGTWFLSDGIYSWKLYVNAPSYQGSPRQTFLCDHWIRLVRIIGAIAIIAIGTQM
jgi:hypothetical protein